MKKTFVICIAIVMSMSLISCGETQVELTNIGKYENMALELLDGSITATEDGRQILRVEAHYQNDNAEPYYAYCSFAVKAYQNHVELTDVSDINGNEAVLIQEVKAGTSIKVSYLFELQDSSVVEVKVCTPTAEQKVIAKKNYLGNISDSEVTTRDTATFAGEWKANKLVGKMADSETYQIYVIKLKGDGSGSYQDKDGMWVHDKEKNQIILTLTKESIGMVLDICEEDGKTILKYYEDVYYKEDE